MLHGSIENVNFSERSASDGGARLGVPPPLAGADARALVDPGAAGAGPLRAPPPAEAALDAAAGRGGELDVTPSRTGAGADAAAGRSDGRDARPSLAEAGQDAAVGRAEGLDANPSRAEAGAGAAAGGSGGPSAAPTRAEEINHSAAVDVQHAGPDIAAEAGAAAGGSEGHHAVPAQADAGPDAAAGRSHGLDAVAALGGADQGAAANHSEGLGVVMSRASDLLETARTLEALVESLGRAPDVTAGLPRSRSDDDRIQARIKAIIVLAGAIALLAAAIICVRHVARSHWHMPHRPHGRWI